MRWRRGEATRLAAALLWSSNESSHYPREIAREIEIDENFNLDRAIYTLSEFLSIEIEIAILRLARSIFSHFTYCSYDDRRSTAPRRRSTTNSTNSTTGILSSVAG
jgi:hypothetical protein